MKSGKGPGGTRNRRPESLDEASDDHGGCRIGGRPELGCCVRAGRLGDQGGPTGRPLGLAGAPAGQPRYPPGPARARELYRDREAGKSGEVRQDRAEIRGDKRELREDVRDRRDDRRDLRQDRRELRSTQDIQRDRKDVRQDRPELRGDKREPREDVRDRRDDRRDLRQDRRELGRDVRNGR